MADERRRKRRFSMIDLELRYRESDAVIGRIQNLSEGGMLAISIEEFEKGAELSLRIPFDKPIEGQIFFDFQAKVVWCMPDAVENYSVGLQFSTNSELQYRFLEKMITLYMNPTD